MKKLGLVQASVSLCAVALAMGCYRAPMLTAWTTGEANAPPDVAEVYRAVLDNIFSANSSGPALVVIDKMTETSIVEVFFRPKRAERRLDAVIQPFPYRIPLAFVDTSTWRELYEKGRVAESVSFTLPDSDPRRFQSFWAPFIAKYPGAWGRLTLGRVAFGPRRDYALVQVRYTSLDQSAGTGQEFFRLAQNNRTWRVVERVPRDGAPIEARPVPYSMIHGRLEPPPPPAPRRKLVRGSVKDSASGLPLSAMVIRVTNAPLGKRGEVLGDKVPEPWGTLFTDSAGKFFMLNPPSGYMNIEVECPPSRGIRGAGLAPATLQPEAGLDTVLDFRVRFASCAESAPALAREAEEHLKRVELAKKEAAARLVQGNIWGTVRDSRTGRPIPRAWIRVDRSGPTGTDSLGRFWLWGFAPGTRTIVIHCPVRRQWFGKIATTLTVQALPAMKDTMDINIDMDRCADVPVDTVRIRTRGVLSSGFEDGFFNPCRRFDQIKLGGYRDFSGLAYLGFAKSVIEPAGGWPKVEPEQGYTRIFLDVEGDLIGPGSYGHMGLGTYELVVTRVVSAKAVSKTSCSDTQ